MKTPYALRVLGSASGRRELVGFDKVHQLYAHADATVHPEVPAFLTAFRYPINLRQHIEAKGNSAGYAGPVGLAAINFDLDRQSIDEALADARRLVAHVAERWSLGSEDIVVAFSGSRGFHVSIPTSGIDPACDNHTIARAVATSVARDIGVTIDESVYNVTQLWRAPNSRHHRTGLFKVRIDADDLPYIDAATIKRLASSPVPFDLPCPVNSPAVFREWAEVSRSVRQAVQQCGGFKRGKSLGCGNINALTWSFLREGADQGERHRLLFSCAANLAEFDSVDELVVALLTSVGLDTGLTARDVERQIRCGIAHARKHTTNELER